MDTTAIAFYAVVCGLLSLASPNFGAPGLRLAVGAIVGVVAAIALPFLKGMLGY